MSTTSLVVWALLALVLLVLVVAASRPDHFRVERSRLVPASAVQVLALVQDFHRWTEWSPWEHIDPSMQRNYSGATSGVGAVYAWSGTGKAGAGCMEIREAEADRVLIQLDFSKPFTAHNMAEFTLVNAGDATHITWAMFGPSPFVSKLMGLVFNMDKFIGADFEKGLANMQAVLQGQSDGATPAPH
jgi:Polyketide cyclase / dehydrase and lipid transport